MHWHLRTKWQLTASYTQNMHKLQTENTQTKQMLRKLRIT